MVGDRRDKVLNNRNLFEPGLSIGSPDDEMNLNSASLAFIKSNKKFNRQINDNSIEDDLFALHQELEGRPNFNRDEMSGIVSNSFK